MIQLGISGAYGRMGQAISKLAFADSDFQISALIEHPEHPKISEVFNGMKVSADNTGIAKCQALIEFTLPEGTLQNLKACVQYKTAMVIGTTGFTDSQVKEIHDAAKRIPIVFASNMSIGVNVLFKLIEIAGIKLSESSIVINETHHVHKKDAPSGTAKTMADVAERATHRKVENINAFRKGEVIGDHDITFETGEDVLTISHHAKTRDMFAKGALKAAKFLVGKNPGLYNMQDVLGLSAIKIDL